MQLPGSGKPFFGRDDERGRIAAALRAPGARLVTLAGLGGIGKTALATRVMSELAADFPDGVHWVPLAPVSDPALVANAVNHALGIPDASPRPPADALTTWLAGKRALLVLDNFEHVMEARPLVARLLAAEPGAVLLVTSREPLGLPEECVIEIGPMPVIALVAPDSATLRENEAARLFEWRARVAGYDFAIDAANAGDVAAICRALDGIPLALELAAARLHLLGVRGLIEHLRQPSLGLLRSSTGEFPERQRAMSLVIGWSYALLGERQRLFRRLCIFTAGFTLDAAEAVGLVEDPSELAPRDAGLTQRDELIEHLDELVRLGLVRSQLLPDGTARYLILETIRAYGLAQLTPEEMTEANWALARYLLLMAEQAFPQLAGAETGVWVTRLESELGNYRAALAWLMSQGAPASATALRIGAALWVFWKIQGHLSEGRAWLERMRALAGDDHDLLVARVTLALGHLEYDDLARCGELYAAAQELFRRAGDARGEAEAWSGLGMLHEQRGDYPRAIAAHEGALAIWTRLEHDGGIALTTYQLGYTANRAGEYARALTYLETARQKWERLGDLSGVSYATLEMGRAFRLLGQLHEAGIILTLGRDRFRRAGIKEIEGIVNTELGLLDLTERNLPRALELLRGALTFYLELDATQSYLLEALEGIAAIASRLGDDQTALRLVLFAVQRRHRTGLVAPPSSQALIETVTKAAYLKLGAQLSAAIKLEAGMLSLAEAAERAFAVTVPGPAAPAVERRMKEGADAPYGKLTGRETQVLGLLAGGMSDQEIADALSISYRTVTTHVQHILSKLGVTSRTAAAALAFRLGLIDDNPLE